MLFLEKYQGPKLYEKAIDHHLDLELTWRNTRLQTYTEIDGYYIQYLVNQRYCARLSIHEDTFQRLVDAHYPRDYYPETNHVRQTWATQFSALPDYNPNPDNYQGMKVHLHLQIDNQNHMLHWRNTKLRFFLDQQLNHVEYYDKPGILKAFQVDSEIMRDLKELLYPARYDPEIDEETYEWLMQCLTRDLEQLQPIDFQ